MEAGVFAGEEIADGDGWKGEKKKPLEAESE